MLAINLHWPNIAMFKHLILVLLISMHLLSLLYLSLQVILPIQSIGF